MKLLRYVIMVLALGCGGEEASVETPAGESPAGEEPTVAETPEAVAAISFDSVPSYFGGSRIAAGAFAVELLPQSDGAVKAYVSKEDGTPVQNASLSVSLQGADGNAHPLSLSWDAAVGAYFGTLDTKPVAGAVSVSVEAGGASGVSRDATINVASPAAYGGHTLLVGNVATEVVVDAGGAILVSARGPEGSLTGDALDLSVSVDADNGEKYSVPLAWDVDANVYAGLLPDDIHPASGALGLSASFGGASYTAGLPRIVVAAPAYQGDIVAVGDLSVEFVAGAEGALQAYITNAEGVAVTGSAADIALKLPSGDASVDLAWDANANAYAGVLPPGLDITTAPLDVRVGIDGRVRRGGIAAAAGRSLGVAWRERVETGAGGAIPPGQARHLRVDADFRARLGARGRGQSLGLGMGMGMVNGMAMGMVNGMAAIGMGPGAGVMVGVEVNAPRVGVEVNGAANQARGAAAAAKARADAIRGSVMAPTVPMVSVMGGATATGGTSAMGSTTMEGASAMGGASAMAGASVMFGL